MPPTLRATPSAPSTPRASTNTDSESPARTPRKSPQCKTCRRPRKGHPRGPCEFADSSPKNPTPLVNPTSPNLVDALAAMDLAERDRKDKRERRHSAQPHLLPSLPSISTVTGELLESLKAPGLLDDDGSEHGGGGDDHEKREIVIRWRELSSTPAHKGATGQRIVPTQSSTLLAEESTPTKKPHVGRRLMDESTSLS